MRFLALFLLCVPALVAQKKPVTLEALEAISGLTPRGPGNPAAWSPDGDQFVYRQGRRLMIYDVASQKSRDLTETNEVADAAVRGSSEPQPFAWENRRVREQDIQWSPHDELLYSTGGDLFVIRIDNGRWRQLTKTPAAERDPKLSPDGTRIAFRRDWDLYVIDLASGKEQRLTTGGSETLRNGGLDWVYPEELDLGTAYWWSPDSRSIAYLQFDVSGEPLHPQVDLRGPRAMYEPERYPKAGDNNPAVRLGVIPAAGGETRWFDTGDTVKEYLIARVTWTPDSKSLYVVRPTRVQDRVQLLAYDVATGRRREVLEESDKHWINVPDEPIFIGDGSQFLWLSERDGFRHIYLYSSAGKQIRQLTRGSWEVTAIPFADDRSVYYVSSEPSPLERHFYRIGLDGGAKQQLTTGEGTHSITMSPSGEYYLHGVSSISAPSRTTLHSFDGRELGVYREADTRVKDDYEILPTELLSFQGPQNTRLYARLIRPAGFDPSKKYPAVVLVYGGPGAQGVRNSWTGADLDQVLAHAGFVVWQVDNRGSAGHGHAFETPVNRKLGEIELRDQLAGLDHLLSMGFVDPQRVGIRGWSYGGFMTLNAMLNAPGKFAAGVAGAPVTDWRNYDTIYTERYMDLPARNEEGYRDTALPRRARNLEGKLMIIHNLEDDNVLFQNSVQMIDALQRAGKPFEMMTYTQKAHSVSGPEGRHLNATILAFFERNLQ